MSALTVAASDAPAQNWSDANQRVLAAELARLRFGLSSDDGDPAALDAAVAAAAAAMPAQSALDRVVETFDLSSFERSLLLLCAGVEMDSGIAAVCAGAGHRAGATFGIALAALDEPHWSALTPARPLRRWRLIDVEPGPSLTASPLRIDERILHFLAGLNLLDPRLQPLLRLHDVPPLIAAGHEQLADRLAAVWARSSRPRPIHLCGDDEAGAEDVAAAAVARCGVQLFVVAADNLPAGAVELETFATLWEREAALLPGALLVQCGEAAISTSVVALLERLHSRVFIAARERPRLRRAPLQYYVDQPAAAEQKRLWQLALAPRAGTLNGTLDGVAAQFRLSSQAIVQAAGAIGERIASGEAAASAVWQTCRSTGRQRLDDLALRVAPDAVWDDLVLPAQQLAALRQIAAQVRQRIRVYDDWGFGRRGARGLGVSALFSGESGTGKTLAAEVLASELHLDLYRIDLSSVVNKYIGETEKNLRRVFDAAEDTGAILLFDEADALFGKRSDVRDSHDRYANIEVSYLLQRMEAYRGLAILTTNLKSALDPAFQRRLRFIVHFPFPDAAQREAIWRRAFPPNTPTAALDFSRLARLHVPGGAVRNIALNAAFLAADNGQPVTMGHLLAAAQAESAKLERPLSTTETRGWE
jgi:hypothetical protein